VLSLPYHVSMTDLLTDLAPFIGSALGGAAVAGMFGIFNRKAGTKDEHKQWLRNEKTGIT